MLNHDRIRKTEAFLKECFDKAAYLNAHPEAKAYRLEHSYRVANIGRQIARHSFISGTFPIQILQQKEAAREAGPGSVRGIPRENGRTHDP